MMEGVPIDTPTNKANEFLSDKLAVAKFSSETNEQKSDTTIELAALLTGLLAKQDKRIADLEGRLAAMEQKGRNSSKNAKQWLTLKEAASVLNVSQKTARRYVERKLLRRNAASRHILIPAEEVERFSNKVLL